MTLTKTEAEYEEALAKVAYTAYCESCGNKSFRGEPLPVWADVVPDIKRHWRAAMHAVGQAMLDIASAEKEAEITLGGSQ